MEIKGLNFKYLDGRSGRKETKKLSTHFLESSRPFTYPNYAPSKKQTRRPFLKN